MDLVKDLYNNNKLYRLSMDPSGIDISGENQILRINSDKITGNLNVDGDLSLNGDVSMNGDLSMNGNVFIDSDLSFGVYKGKVGIGKTPENIYSLDIIGAINCTAGVFVNNSSLAAGTGEPIVAKGMTVQIKHKDYSEKVIKVEEGWRAIDSREDGNGFVVKIKPTSIQSKVLVSTVVHIGQHTGYDSRWWGVRLYRKIGNGSWDEVTGAKGENDTTTLYSDGVSENYLTEPTISGTSVWFSNNQGMFVAGEVTGAISSYLIGNSTASYLDSPGTTEEVAYTLWWNSGMADPNVNRQLFLNRSQEMGDLNRLCTQSSLTATEIWDDSTPYKPTDSAIMIDTGNDNVGIGTSTPATGLDIHRDLSLNGNIEISGNDTFVITNQGHVGVGTTYVDFPLKVQAVTTAFGNNGVSIQYKNSYMDIARNMTWSLDWNRAYTFDTFGGDGNLFFGNDDALGGAEAEYSAFFKGALVIPGFEIFSDRRIKTDISLVDDDTALNLVNALESYEYNYVDPFKRKKKKTIGFIAQEVKEVVPNAYGIIKEVIPDEMRIIAEPVWREDASNNWLLDIPDLDMSGAFTGKAKFYVSNDPSGNDEVCKEVEIEPDKKTFVFDQSWNNVFFYGKEVSDFHTIDKNQIFALHHSAIQELDRKHKREVAEKNNEITELKSEVNSLTSRMEALEASVLALQNN